MPQRRRRISLVVDFGGQSAGEILFERQSLSGDSEPGKQERKEAAGDIADGSGKHDCVAIEPGIAAREGGHYYEGVSGTLRSNAGDNQMSVACPMAFTQNSRDEVRGLGDKAGCISAEPGMHQQNYVAETVALEGNGQRESHKGDGFKQTDKMYTLNTTEVHGVAYGFCPKNGSGAGSVGFQKECAATIQSAPCSFQMGGVAYLLNDQGGASINVEDGSTSPTLRAESHQHEPNVCYALDCRNCAVNKELSATIQAKPNGGFSYNCVNPVCYGICSYASNSMKSGNPDSGIYEADTSRTLDLNGGNPACNQGGVAVCEPRCVQNTGQGWWNESDIGATVRTPCGGDAVKANLVCEPTIYDMTHANDVIRDCGSTCPTLQNRMGTGGNQIPLTIQRFIRWIVRRLTPLECTRLQGYPDGWVDIGEWTDSKGKVHKDADSPKYKALGNSIALPFWLWMFKRMAKYLPDDATLGSLFDGIGGFPLCWERVHGKGTAVWASEIEEFPIAVTKIRFPELQNKE